jgi:hydrogenase maturation protease
MMGFRNSPNHLRSGFLKGCAISSSILRYAMPSKTPTALKLKGEGKERKRIVLGLGNVFMRDDGIGIHVAREVRQRDLGTEVDVYDYQEMDLTLLGYFEGASKLVVVDALKSGNPPGTVSKYSIAPREDTLTQLPSLHGLQLFDLFDLAKQAGLLSCPVIIVGVEPKDCSPGEEMSEELADALPRAVDEVIKELRIGLPKTSSA